MKKRYKKRFESTIKKLKIYRGVRISSQTETAVATKLAIKKLAVTVAKVEPEVKVEPVEMVKMAATANKVELA